MKRSKENRRKAASRVMSRCVRLALCAGMAALSMQGLAAPARAGNTEVQYGCYGFGPADTFSRPTGLFYDAARDECYVADTGNHRVVICDGNGMPTFRFRHSVEHDGSVVEGEPKSLAVNEDGYIFLVDALAVYIDVLDQRGRSIQTIYPPDDGCSLSHRFDLVVLAPAGYIAAATSCPERRIAVINRKLDIERVIELDAPTSDKPCLTGLAIDAAERLYVTDSCGFRMVQVYDPDGEYRFGFGLHETGMENFSMPSSIALMDNGEIWVSDAIRQVASRFTSNGDYIETIGGKGIGPGAFNYPSCLATNGKSLVLVLERAGNRYQCFRSADSDESTLGMGTSIKTPEGGVTK